MQDFANAIASIESAGSGGYAALGPKTKSGDRAYGRYQVMGTNIPEWTKAALGKSMAPEDFLADPTAQDTVFQHRFGSYVDKYGNPQDAAAAWFTGRPLAQGAGAKDVLGTTGQSYVDQFNRALGQPAAGAPAPASSQASTATAAPAGLLAALGQAPQANPADVDIGGLLKQYDAVAQDTPQLQAPQMALGRRIGLPPPGIFMRSRIG